MKLTGKAELAFREWYLWIYLDLSNVSQIQLAVLFSDFNAKPPLEKALVLIKWFNTVNIYPQVSLHPMPSMNEDNEPIRYHSFVETTDKWFALDFSDTDEEAYELAIKAANEIYNENYE